MVLKNNILMRLPWPTAVEALRFFEGAFHKVGSCIQWEGNSIVKNNAQ